MEKLPPVFGVATQKWEEYKDNSAIDSHNLGIEVESNITGASTIVHQRYLTAIITVFWAQTLTCHKAHTFKHTPDTSVGEPNSHYHFSDMTEEHYSNNP